MTFGWINTTNWSYFPESAARLTTHFLWVTGNVLYWVFICASNYHSVSLLLACRQWTLHSPVIWLYVYTYCLNTNLMLQTEEGGKPFFTPLSGRLVHSLHHFAQEFYVLFFFTINNQCIFLTLHTTAWPLKHFKIDRRQYKQCLVRLSVTLLIHLWCRFLKTPPA